MAITPITLTFNGDQTLTVNSVLADSLDGFAITSNFAGVTITGTAPMNGRPAEAGWHNGPVWLDLKFITIQENALFVLQVSGTATTPNGASQIATFTVLGNAWPFSVS